MTRRRRPVLIEDYRRRIVEEPHGFGSRERRSHLTALPAGEVERAVSPER